MRQLNVRGFLLVVLALALPACKGKAAAETSNQMQDETRTKSGVADDSIKPVPPGDTTLNARTGVADDSIKPVPPGDTLSGKKGVADDSIKPAPGNTLNARGGVADDSVKPMPPPLKTINPKAGVRDPSIQPVGPKPAPVPTP
jgi:hypothetical protein